MNRAGTWPEKQRAEHRAHQSERERGWHASGIRKQYGHERRDDGSEEQTRTDAAVVRDARAKRRRNGGTEDKWAGKRRGDDQPIGNPRRNRAARGRGREQVTAVIETGDNVECD